MVHSLHSLLVACQDGDTAKVESILQVISDGGGVTTRTVCHV